MGLCTCMPNETTMVGKFIQKNQIVQSSEKVPYTHGVLRQDSKVQWGSCWDVYLPEGLLVPEWVHLYSFIVSILVVLLLSLVVVSILVRNLKRAIAGYNAIAVLANKEHDEEVDGTGWKFVHGAVFCPPASADHGLRLVVAAPVLDVTIPRDHVVPCLSVLLVFLGACSACKADFIG